MAFGRFIQPKDIPHDPFAGTIDTIQAYYHIQSIGQGGSDPNLTVPASPNYPETGSQNRYFLEFRHRIDVSDLGAARPITIYDEDDATALTRVTGSPSTNQFRIPPETSIRRSVGEFYSSQAGHELSYDFYGVGGIIDEEMAKVFNNFEYDQYSTDVSYTITNYDGYRKIIPDHSMLTGLITLTLPDVAANEDRTILVQNGGDGLTHVSSAVASKIYYKDSLITTFPLLMLGDYVELRSNGTYWFIERCYSHLDTGSSFLLSGGISNDHLTNCVIYDDGSGTSTKSVDWTGQHITESDTGVTAIIIEDTGGATKTGTLHFYNLANGYGFTNNKILTASNGETIDVNQPTGSSISNTTQDFFHNLGLNIEYLDFKFWWNTSSSMDNASFVIIGSNFDTSNDLAIQPFTYDANSIRWQTGANGVHAYKIDDSGQLTVQSVVNPYFRHWIEIKM